MTRYFTCGYLGTFQRIDGIWWLIWFFERKAFHLFCQKLYYTLPWKVYARFFGLCLQVICERSWNNLDPLVFCLKLHQECSFWLGWIQTSLSKRQIWMYLKNHIRVEMKSYVWYSLTKFQNFGDSSYSIFSTRRTTSGVFGFLSGWALHPQYFMQYEIILMLM